MFGILMRPCGNVALYREKYIISSIWLAKTTKYGYWILLVQLNIELCYFKFFNICRPVAQIMLLIKPFNSATLGTNPHGWLVFTDPFHFLFHAFYMYFNVWFCWQLKSTAKTAVHFRVSSWHFNQTVNSFY